MSDPTGGLAKLDSLINEYAPKKGAQGTPSKPLSGLARLDSLASAYGASSPTAPQPEQVPLPGFEHADIGQGEKVAEIAAAKQAAETPAAGKPLVQLPGAAQGSIGRLVSRADRRGAGGSGIDSRKDGVGPAEGRAEARVRCRRDSRTNIHPGNPRQGCLYDSSAPSQYRHCAGHGLPEGIRYARPVRRPV